MNDGNRQPDLLDELAADAPEEKMRSRFEELLDEPGRRPRRPAAWMGWAAAAVLAIAVTLAVRQQPTAAPESEARIQAALELLHAPSTFERLRGVNAAAQWLDGSPALNEALLERLTEDDSVSVRLSALDTLLRQSGSTLAPNRLTGAFAAQDTAIVQAHLGHRLLRTRLVSRAELDRLINQTGVHADARRVLLEKETS